MRATAGEEWLKTGSVAVAEGGSLMQAAYAQRRLVIRHATKISKRLALKKDAPLSVGLKGPYSIMNVQRPSSMPDVKPSSMGWRRHRYGCRTNGRS